jgi:hypothetical protein
MLRGKSTWARVYLAKTGTSQKFRRVEDMTPISKSRIPLTIP